METLTPKQMEIILNEILAEKYPEESIEMGENWELLARIFFELGRNTATSK